MAFYCDDCADDAGWPKETFIGSHGPCEICGRVLRNNDIPSRALTIAKVKMDHDSAWARHPEWRGRWT